MINLSKKIQCIKTIDESIQDNYEIPVWRIIGNLSKITPLGKNSLFCVYGSLSSLKKFVNKHY